MPASTSRCRLYDGSAASLKKAQETYESYDLDKTFDAGEDITKHLDLSKARRPWQESKRTEVELPVWMITSLDKEVKQLGVPRQSLIKMLIARHLDKTRV